MHQALLPHISPLEILFRLGAAAILAGAIGVEREWRDQNAGFRTHLLVGLGSALFTLTSAYGFSDFHFSQSTITTDPTRIAAQIVSGVGFLGAGAIIRQGLSVRGLTTAASLWAVSAIGLACGAGFYMGGAIGTALILIGLGPGRMLDRKLQRATTGMLRVSFTAEAPTGPIMQLISQVAPATKFQIQATGEGGGELRTPCRLTEEDRAELVQSLFALDGVDGVTWA